MEGHDKATAMDILNIPADLVSTDRDWETLFDVIN